ncbi:MAG: hypothetical protein ACLS90_01420 [Clostridia bacterium]
MKNKKTRVIIISVILVLIIGIAIFCVVKTRNTGNSNQTTGLAKIYEKMTKNNVYKISFELNEDSKYTISRKDNKANIDTYNNGTHIAETVKDGNTYYLIYSTNTYYEYENNDTELTQLTDEINEIITNNQDPAKGQEDIDGKKYRYEEYKDISYFAFNIDEDTVNKEVSTKFYFKGDKLQYIKTKIGDKEELVKVDLSYDVKEDVFEIPSNFNNGAESTGTTENTEDAGTAENTIDNTIE